MYPEQPSTEDPTVFRGPASWTLNLKTGELHSSEARAVMMGYEPSAVEPTAQWWDQMLHPNERLAVCMARSRSLAGADSGYRSEYRARRQNDEWIWLLEIGCVVRNQAGVVEVMQGVIVDITVDREAQFRSQQRLERMSVIFDHTQRFTGLLSPDGTLLEMNRSVLRSWGVSLRDVMGKPLWEMSSYAREPAGTELLRDGVARAGRGEFVRFPLQVESATAGKRIIDISLSPIFDDSGLLTSILCDGRDVTDIVSARQQLRTLEDRLAVAVSTSLLGLWDLNLRTGEGWHSDNCWTMLGYEPHEIGSSMNQWLELLHPDDLQPTMALIEKQREASDEFRAEYRVRAKDGSWRWIHAHGRVVPSSDPNGGTRMAGVHLDITERKEGENRLHAAERLESVGKLAAGVAHEINTPVQFVSDSIYFVRDGLYELLALIDRLRALASRDQCNVNSVAALSAHLPYLIENLPKALERSLEGLKRVSEIVSSMRELAHPARPEMSAVDVNRVIETALVVGRSEYKYVAEIVTEFQALPPVKCHAGELNQVILNLLINASHAIADAAADSDQKGLIKVSTRLESNTVLISVSDTGTGVPESIRHRIFEPFFTTKEVGRGTGQGLAISHNIIVNRHGGSIDFESAPGRGAVFHVRLPCDCRLEPMLPQSSAERAA
jgi:two-component system NtrC family sensor kinase